MDYTLDFGFSQQQDFGMLSAPSELHDQQPRYHHDFEPSHAAMQDHLQDSAAEQKISCDVKPRLTKEQHDVLEAHYQKQQKPNTSTKRGFADALNVSLEKVNNWFQNRRAKSKQDVKKQHGPVNIFSVPQQPRQTSLGASDSEALPAFASAEYHQMMQDEDVLFAYEQPQLMTVNSEMNYLLPEMISADELNRRTLTQEQFDAFEQQDAMLNSGGLAMLSANPETFTKFVDYSGQTQAVPFDYAGIDQHTISAPSSEWTDSRSSSATSLLSQSFEQHSISTPLSQFPPSQWQPGQSVPVNFDLLNQEFREAAQARQIPMEQPLSWPSPEQKPKRDSSTSLDNVSLHTPQPLKSPAPVSSLAARRQRQRPTPLGLLSLRSQSYSGTAQLLGSPGQMQPPSNTPPQLRRIKSSNVVGGIAQGRVQKNIAPPQRSPLNWSFSDAMVSPQLVRHASSTALAPSTPLSPPDNTSDFFRGQRQWQNASKHINRQASISETDAEHAFAPAQNFTSPPHTPMLYPHQHFLPPQIIPGNMISMENTPPQSAPASQSCFPPNIYGHSPQQQMHQFQPPIIYHPQPMQHVFMPQSHQVMDNIIEQEQVPITSSVPQFTVTTSGPGVEMPLHFAQNGLPVVDAEGQISLAMPSQLQFVQHKVPRSDSKQGIPAGSQTIFSVTKPIETMQITAQVPKNSTPSEFFVHEYTPPQDIKQSTTPRKAVDTGPKNYTFANHTPKHFEKGGEKSKKSEKSSGSNSPDSTSG